MQTRPEFLNFLEEIFDIPRGSLQLTDTRDTVPAWTSIADVQILSSIAAEFGIEADADLLVPESVGELLQALEDKGAFGR
jgi:acyl carrier protein